MPDLAKQLQINAIGAFFLLLAAVQFLAGFLVVWIVIGPYAGRLMPWLLFGGVLVVALSGSLLGWFSVRAWRLKEKKRES